MLKSYKAITPSLRFLQQVNFKNIFLKKKKIKTQCFGLSRSYGRNNKGQITSYHKGGGCKRVYRKLRPYSQNFSIVEGLEYDPYRSAFLMRVFDYQEKKLYYQIAPDNIQRGTIIQFNEIPFNFQPGMRYYLHQFPLGSIIHNINFFQTQTNRISVSAGTYSQVIQKTHNFCLLKLSSGELKQLPLNSIGVFGRVSNLDHQLKVLGKAGRKRWLNCRPKVRGVAMNPIDHPHGGGQGKTSAGRPSVSPWGKLTKGQKTKKN